MLLRPVLMGNNKALAENGEDGIAMLILYAKVPFSSTSFCKIFQDSPSHRIFRRMHEALNINKK